MKSILNGIAWGLVAVLVLSTNAWSFGRKTVIKVGINAPITGDIPKVGEGTKYAAQMWLADIEKAGGIEVGGKKYPVELVIEDNEAKAESAVKANTKMITEDEVLVIVGPQSSKQAVPAGDVANNYEIQTPPRTVPLFSGAVSSILSRDRSWQISLPKSLNTPKRRCSMTSPATTPRALQNFSGRPGKKSTVRVRWSLMRVLPQRILISVRS
jgi:hypothetical protein